MPIAPIDRADDALLARLRAGEPAAFEAMVREYGGRLLATARRLLGNEEDAREALQDAFASAFQSIGGFAGESQLSTWLHRIVVNAALMKLRRRKCRPEGSLDALLPSFVEDGHHAEPPCPWGDRVQADIERHENAALVRRAIDELPATYREVLVLRDLEGLSTEATAAVVGVTPNAIKIRLHRARQALRTLLAHHFEEVQP